MLVLTGQRKLHKDIGQLGQFQRRVNRAMVKKQSGYRRQAKDIVTKVVYSHKENPLYPRSGNTAASTNILNSMRVDGVPAGDGAMTVVFLDPTMATRSFKYDYRGGVTPQGLASYWAITGQGGKNFYPSYVRLGNLFGRKVEARDFRAGWLTHFVPIYTRDAGRAVRNFRRG